MKYPFNARNDRMQKNDIYLVNNRSDIIRNARYLVRNTNCTNCNKCLILIRLHSTYYVS